MPTPLHLKPPTAAWIVRERRRLDLKPRDVAARLNAMGYADVTEATVKVWESNANRRPSPQNIEGLERLFESKAPDAGPAVGEIGALVAALNDLARQIALSREEEAVARIEMMRAIAALAGGRGPQGTPDAAERGTHAGARP